MEVFDRTSKDAPGGGPAGADRAGFAVLAAGLDSRRGGAAMRWEALGQALSRHAPSALYRVTCNRWQQCRATCRLTGAETLPELNEWYFTHSFCRAYAAELAQEFTRTGVSTVICSGLETFRYASTLAEWGRFRLVFDMHNVEYPLNLSIRQAGLSDGSAYWTEFFTEAHVEKVRAAEQEAIAAADELWVCSDHDQRELTAVYPDTPATKIRVVPNVVDPGTFPSPSATVHRICFTGRIEYPPNLLAARTIVRQIAPLLIGSTDQLPIVIAGRMAGEALAGEPLPPQVTLVSNPENVAAEVIAGSIMLVPLTMGSGSRFKILEAFAAGAPVVSTPKGAEGLDIIAGTHYLAASEPAEFAAAVQRLVSDRQLRTRLTAAARTLVEERYSVHTLAEQLAAVAGDGRSG